MVGIMSGWLLSLLALAGFCDLGTEDANEEYPGVATCSLVDTRLQEAIHEILRRGECPAASSSEAHRRVFFLLHRHEDLHGWLHDEDGLPRRRTCSRGDLLRLREWGLLLARARYCRLVRPIATILERNGLEDEAVAVLSAVPLAASPDGPPCPPGFGPRPDRRCCEAERLLGDVERRRGRWEAALAHYEASRSDYSCVGPSGRLRDGRRLECLAELCRWEEYRALCRERLRRRNDTAFVAHLIESYRAQDALAFAGFDVLVSLDVICWYRRPTDYYGRSFYGLRRARRSERALADAAVHLAFLRAARRGSSREMSELLEVGLSPYVFVNAVRRLEQSALVDLLQIAWEGWDRTRRSHDDLLRLLAASGREEVRPFLLHRLRREEDSRRRRTLEMWHRTWDQAHRGAAVWLGTGAERLGLPR